MSFSNIDDPRTFSERKLAGGGDRPWSLEEIVEAQQMDCAGDTEDIIAAALGRTITDVRAKLKPALEQPRPDRAGVGFSAMKGNR